jgi:hypothetical protein
LAAHLGMTQDELCDRMSQTEFLEWIAREQFEPIPDQWMMWRFIMSAITGQKPEKFEFRTKQQSIAGIKGAFMALAKRK